MGFTSAITMSWDANTESDLAGYHVFAGRATGVYDDEVNVGNVTTYSYTINAPGPWFFIVKALDTTGNVSNQSNEISRSFLPLGNFPQT